MRLVYVRCGSGHHTKPRCSFLIPAWQRAPPRASCRSYPACWFAGRGSRTCGQVRTIQCEVTGRTRDDGSSGTIPEGVTKGESETCPLHVSDYPNPGGRPSVRELREKCLVTSGHKNREWKLTEGNSEIEDEAPTEHLEARSALRSVHSWFHRPRCRGAAIGSH